MSQTICKWIESGKNLPVLSGAIAKLMHLTLCDQSSISQIADVIKRDVGLSAAILRITNSSAFGLLRKVTSIDQAVVLLGFKAVRNIALAVGVVDQFSPSDSTFLSKIWQRSILSGIAARELSSLGGNMNQEDAFTNGLLHDIGLIAFYAFDKNLANQLIERMETNGRLSLDEEKALLGMDHVELGCILAEKWGLPNEVILSILNHHAEPVHDHINVPKNNVSPLYYLSTLVGDIFYLGNKSENIKEFMNKSKSLMGIDTYKAEGLLHDIHPQLVELASYFQIDVEAGKNYEQIMCEANEEILNITVSNEATKYHLTQAFEREKKLAEELEKKNHDLKLLASKDSLTGLYNRQFLDELLEKEWFRSKRGNLPLSMAMVDIDDFKRINDTYGHKAGDVVLIKIAEAFKNKIRKNDFVARYGGEEFAFIFPETDIEKAGRIAEIINRLVYDLDTSSFIYDRVTLSISSGVSTAYPAKEGDSLDGLMKRADDALYEAKRSGKNKVIVKK
ncbi:MAG: GGDEF domain-containing protein [Deltaproteobacteria bacterium]|nr:GGDEF domain-containing protein [Deltaproteobacteria bacterium]